VQREAGWPYATRLFLLAIQCMGKMQENIALIGFMGSGKSTVGRLLAQKLDWRFQDTDALIEKVAGCSIPTLFSRDGEVAFRDRETTVLLGITLGERQVIATGGGAILREENVAALRSRSLVVYLTAQPEVLAERVSRRPEARPLLMSNPSESPLTRILTMLAERGPLYQQAAHCIVDTSSRTPAALSDEIIRRLQKDNV
jgi:shikimate kinase